MSSVFVHIGQCGNQIGQEFWLKTSATSEVNSNVKRVFHTPGGPGRDKAGHMRAVFIDSEKKVLQKLMKHGKNSRKKTDPILRFGHTNVISCAKGCGSNWSLGCNKMAEEKVMKPWNINVHSYSHEFEYGSEDSILKTSMEAVRHEVEACDCFSGFIMFHSLAGGTGSGFGARMSSELRDRYPVAYQLSITVAPNATGECPTQSYNEALCLAYLQENSDAIMIFENDEILNLLPKKSSNPIFFEQMNSYIADCIVNLLTPVSSLTPPNGVSIGIEPWELIRSVAPMHPTKLLHCRTVTEYSGARTTSAKPVSWDSLCNRICQETRTKFLQTKAEAYVDDSTLAAVCVCRNATKSRKNGSPEIDIAKVASKAKNAYNCVKWNPFPIDVWVDEQSNPKVLPKSLTICSNTASLGTVHCANVLKSAKLKFDSKAYLHWYERYGTCPDEFERAFEVVQGIVEEYEKAVKP